MTTDCSDEVGYYSDSDHAGDRSGTTRSHTGVIITLNGVPCHWVSRKQPQGTAYSSTMVEVHALELSEGVRCALLFAYV